MRNAVVFAAALVLLASRTVAAHSFAKYVSTPITPPAGYVWLIPVSLSLLTIALIAAFRWIAKTKWLAAILSAFGSVLLFAFVFHSIGRFSAMSSTAVSRRRHRLQRDSDDPQRSTDNPPNHPNCFSR